MLLGGCLVLSGCFGLTAYSDVNEFSLDTADNPPPTDDTRPEEDPVEEWIQASPNNGVDLDGDGFVAGLDCDDLDPSRYPGNPAVVDGVDSDCDGRRDWWVTVYVAVDDQGELCIDTDTPIVGDTDIWTTGRQYQLWLSTGLHAIGIKGWDTGRHITAGIAHIEISTGQVWVTDDSWRYDPAPTLDPNDRVGWCQPSFDDSHWDLVLDIGPIGISPWGNAPSVFPDDSPAHWVWDHFPVDLNTQYLRKEFDLP
jgi:hypothetical protein